MANLFNQVVTENYTGFGGEGVSVAIENEVNLRITEDEDSGNMMQYTGECLMGMMAIETVIAQKEGEMAIQYMNARASGSTSTMESLVATFEGFIGDAWEKIKEWIKKAYTAVKNFLIKIWNKLKGYAATVKAFFGKYGDVLRSINDTGAKCEWGTIHITKVQGVYDTHEKQISTVQQGLIAAANMTTAASQSSGSKLPNDINDQLGDAARQTMNNKLPKPVEIMSLLNNEVYGNSEGYKTKKDVSFTTIREQAIEAADINNVQKYINHFLTMGDQGMKYDLDVINKSKKGIEKKADEHKEAGNTQLLGAIRRCVNARLELHRTCSSFLTTAAKRMISQSVAACRAAIMYHHTKGKGASSTEEAWNPTLGGTLDGMLADII